MQSESDTYGCTGGGNSICGDVHLETDTACNSVDMPSAETRRTPSPDVMNRFPALPTATPSGTKKSVVHGEHSIAGIGWGPVTGHRSDDAIGRYLTDPEIWAVRYKYVASHIESQGSRYEKLGCRSRPAVT